MENLHSKVYEQRRDYADRLIDYEKDKMKLRDKRLTGAEYQREILNLAKKHDI